MGADGIFRAKLRVQNVGFGNLTRNVPARLVFVDNLEENGTDVCPSAYMVNLPNLDFRQIHGRTISVAGGDTVMTFDGNNEIEIDDEIYPENDVSVAGRFKSVLNSVYNFGDQQLNIIYNAVLRGLKKYGEKIPRIFEVV